MMQNETCKQDSVGDANIPSVIVIAYVTDLLRAME